MIKIGDSYEEKVSFTNEIVRKFAEVSGDFNPIHLNEQYAKTTIFGGVIVPGMLAASVFSKIFGTEFPGEGTIYLSQDFKFLAPVYPNVEYTARVEVLEIIKEKHNAVFSTTLKEEDNKLCISGIAKLKHKDLI